MSMAVFIGISGERVNFVYFAGKNFCVIIFQVCGMTVFIGVKKIIACFTLVRNAALFTQISVKT
jgi:hypothetical protein